MGEGEDMGLATTYIVVMFAIFVSLLSFILSSYGGQVTTRSSSHPKDGRIWRAWGWPPPTVHCCHVCHLYVPSLLHSLLLRRSGNYQILSHPKDDVGFKGSASRRLLLQGISRVQTKRSDAL
jgi:hypothetical protein